MNSGVYKITNIANGKYYIGSSKNFKKRQYEHFSKLKKNKHYNNHLQLSFNRYGRDSFIFEIIATCPPEKFYLMKLEQFFINNQKPHYNKTEKAYTRTGLQNSEESKIKLSNTLKEKWKNNGSYKLSRIQIEGIKQLIKQGLLLKDIAKTYNVNCSTISDIKIKYKLNINQISEERRKFNKREPYQKEFIDKMIESFLESNLTRIDFIRKNNLPESTFYRILKPFGNNLTNKLNRIDKQQENEIKDLLLNNVISYREIGKLCNVSNSTVCLVNKKFKIRQ